MVAVLLTIIQMMWIRMLKIAKQQYQMIVLTWAGIVNTLIHYIGTTTKAQFLSLSLCVRARFCFIINNKE